MICLTEWGRAWPKTLCGNLFLGFDPNPPTTPGCRPRSSGYVGPVGYKGQTSVWTDCKQQTNNHILKDISSIDIISVTKTTLSNGPCSQTALCPPLRTRTASMALFLGHPRAPNMGLPLKGHHDSNPNERPHVAACRVEC